MAPDNQSLEATVGRVCESINESCAECFQRCEEKIRNAPLASVLVAAGIGYILRFLPLGPIAGGLIRLLVALIRPAIVIFGAIKLFDYLKGRGAAPESESSGAPRSAGFPPAQ